MRKRGVAAAEIEREIAMALVGCLWEIDNGRADRFVAVINEMADGAAVVELFPDGMFGCAQL